MILMRKRYRTKEQRIQLMNMKHSTGKTSLSYFLGNAQVDTHKRRMGLTEEELV